MSLKNAPYLSNLNHTQRITTSALPVTARTLDSTQQLTAVHATIFLLYYIVLLLTDIPFFKQVVIMATVCDACGKRDNEVKSGTGIEPTGTRITLRLTDATDLSRDILKVRHCCSCKHLL